LLFNLEDVRVVMKRAFDIFISLMGIFFLFVPALIIAILIKVSSEGAILFWSKRVGLNGKAFMMPKFRSMLPGAPEVATSVLRNPDYFITPLGAFLRRTSLDEVPQLLSVLVGYMSIVGPRPALCSQIELNEKRKNLGIDKLRPGITGLAQIRGRDKLELDEKIKFDHLYFKNLSFSGDLKIILLTFLLVIKRKNIKH